MEKEAKALARQAKKREREEALVALKAACPERPRRDCAKPESKKAQLRGTRLALKRQPRRMRDEEEEEDEDDEEEDEEEEEEEEEEVLFEEGYPGGDALAEEEEAAEPEAEGKEE